MKEIVANKIKAIKEYLKYFPDDRTANDNLILYEYSNLLDIDLDTNYRTYYPRVEYGYLRVNPQIKLGRGYQLVNSYTGYHQNKKEILVIWKESCGRLAFVDDRYYRDVDNEWREFMNILKSYEPLDYDLINNTYIYDIEHGKKLIADYKDIVGNFKEKLRSKVNEILIQDKREQLKQLQEELKVLNNA